MAWQRILDWIGGAVSRTTVTGLLSGVLIVLFGMSPTEMAVYFLTNPPDWLMSGWFRLLVVIIGLVLIYASLRFNIWSERQRAVDSLAEDISWAIHELVNRHHRLTPEELKDYPQKLREDFDAWCARVSKKLSNRAFFTRADQIHFDSLGFVDPIRMTEGSADHTLSMLKLKFARLRDIIQWMQQRPR